jgi:hypothetical protein
MILKDKSLISEMVLSQRVNLRELNDLPFRLQFFTKTTKPGFHDSNSAALAGEKEQLVNR